MRGGDNLYGSIVRVAALAESFYLTFTDTGDETLGLNKPFPE